YFKISRYVTDRWLQSVGWIENEAINKGIGQVNRLRVVTKGRQATAYINDKQVATFNGQPPQGGGRVGVSGGSPENAQNTWQFTKLQEMAISLATALSQPPAGQPSPTANRAQQAPSPPQQPMSRVALRLHGSTTIGKELVPALCEEFL